MQEELIIRPLNDGNLEDYAALAALYGYAYPEESITPFELKMSDMMGALDRPFKRRLAELGGRIVGVGGFEHWESFYHPDKYLLHVIVAPQFQNRNIGRALYLDTIKRLETLDPVEVQCWIQSDRPHSVKFAEACGFKKMKVKWNFALDINSFNPEPFAAHIDAAREQGIEIKSFSELESDFDRDRKFYDLYIKTVDSIESAGEPQIPSFDELMIKKDQNAFQMTFIAVDGDTYAGLWQIETGAGNSLFGGAMGVDKQYRRSGVAYALAVHGLEYARSCRYDKMIAHTDEHNLAILKVTEKLGFVRNPAELLYAKQYRSE